MTEPWFKYESTLNYESPPPQAKQHTNRIQDVLNTGFISNTMFRKYSDKRNLDKVNYIGNDDVDYVLRITTSNVEKTVTAETRQYEFIPKKRNFLLVPPDMFNGGKKHLSAEDLRLDRVAGGRASPLHAIQIKMENNRKPTSIGPLTAGTSSTASPQININFNNNFENKYPILVNTNKNTFKPFVPGNFSVGGLIGQGHYSDIYIAIEKAYKGNIALKILLKQQISQYGINRQVYNQIKILSSLQHPNIISMFGYYHDQNCVYMTLEYIVSGSLRQNLEKTPKKFYAVRTIAIWIKSLANALIYLHDRNVIHRNIIPENLLIAANGHIKLSGFGSSTYGPTVTGMITCDIVDYLAPEMLAKKSYTKQVDVWSLGILTYELLYGRSPFLSVNSDETCRKIIAYEYKFPNNSVMFSQKFINHLLEYAPEKRMQLKNVRDSEFIRCSIPI